MKMCRIGISDDRKNKQKLNNKRSLKYQHKIFLVD